VRIDLGTGTFQGDDNLVGVIVEMRDEAGNETGDIRACAVAVVQFDRREVSVPVHDLGLV
jgi:hypothetical protein